MEPDHFSCHIHTFQARLWHTLPCLFLVQRLPMQEHDSTGSPCEAGPSLQQECSRGGRNERREWLGGGREKAVSRAGRSSVCESSTPALQAEAVWFPLVRNTCVPFSERRVGIGCEYLIVRGYYRKRRCHFLTPRGSIHLGPDHPLLVSLHGHPQVVPDPR